MADIIITIYAICHILANIFLKASKLFPKTQI